MTYGLLIRDSLPASNSDKHLAAPSNGFLTAAGSSSARMRHFHALDREQQVKAIRRLAAAGQGAHTIAHATGLSVEQVRLLLRNGASRALHGCSTGDRVLSHTEGAGQ
jgi:hypothetical protein